MSFLSTVFFFTAQGYA